VSTPRVPLEYPSSTPGVPLEYPSSTPREEYLAGLLRSAPSSPRSEYPSSTPREEYPSSTHRVCAPLPSHRWPHLGPICARTGHTPATSALGPVLPLPTSAPGLGPPLPHLRLGTPLPISAQGLGSPLQHLGLGSTHIGTGTGLTPAHICTSRRRCTMRLQKFV
jgi:hypothetical protein